MAVTKFATRESLAGALLLSCALLAASPVRAQEPNLWDKMVNTVGLGGNKAAPQQAAPQPVQQAPVQASPVAPQPAQAAQPAAQSPGLFDNVLGKVGFGAKTDPTSIDYSERQKLAVPQTRDLPPPRPQPERTVTRSAERDEALTKPPGEYLQKVPGQDGQISGLRDGDTSKEKKFFGLF
jgi:hypothetical protein